MSSFVNVPKGLLQLPERFRRGLDKGAKSVENTLKNGVRDSIMRRWYRTGESAHSITSEIIDNAEGHQIVVRSGTPYDVFGEYGTGRRGSADAPSFKPASWKYGDLDGMKPRMAFHLGAEEVLLDMLKDLATAIRSEMTK